MLGNRFLVTLNYLDADLAANDTHRFRLPFGFTLLAVNACCAASDSFILDVGTIDNDDEYLDGKTVEGSATVTTLFGASDFVGGQCPYIPANTEMLITIDYDGGDGGDAGGVSLTLVCAEGQ